MTSPSVSAARPHVTTVVVAHEGASWIPHLVSSLEASTLFPDQLVAVDTGSTDDSARILRQAIGPDAVIDASADTGFGAAVQLGLDAVEDSVDPRRSWVWLLHDDCAPTPDTLERLLATAALDEDIAVVGCRVRAWPRGRRLLEVGVSIAGTGKRRTGLEPGEYDQGQHDEIRDVLSVSSAGMLVRRDVWNRLSGFDRRLPLFRDDADFGWRVARAGHRIVVAPDAVLHHAEAASRGVRPIANTAARPHQADRQAALYTLLVNCSAVAFPWQLVRLVVGTLLRAAGFLLGKLPSAAVDELRALGHVLGHPLALVAARHRRRRTATVAPRRVRRLLPRWWSPYSDGAESLLEAATDQIRARAAKSEPLSARLGAARRDPRALETGPVDEDSLNLPVGVSPWVWVLSHPLLAMLVGLTLLGLLAGRGLWGTGLLQGGALLPAPPDASDWWRLYSESWHPVQLGSTDATSPYVALLAMLGTLALGNAWLVVDILMLLSVPLCALGAFVVSRRLVGGLATRVWMALAYALLPVVSGAVTSGHLGTVVSLVLLPWLLRSFLRIGEIPRWRPVFGAGLVLAAVVAFAPIAWIVVLVLSAASAVWAVRRGLPMLAVRVLTAVLLPLALLLPWSWRLLTTPSLFLTEAGIVRTGGGETSWQALFGRLDAAGDAPLLLTVGIGIAALLAIVRSDRRAQVAAAWVAAAGCLLLAAILAGVPVGVPGTSAEALTWLGVPVVWAQAALVVAAGIGADGLATTIRSGSFSWRQPVAAVAVVLAISAPVASIAWWAVSAPQGDLSRESDAVLPAYMTDAMQRDVQQKVLVVTGDSEDADYRLLVDDGVRLGEDSVLPPDSEPELTDVLRRLLSQAGPEDVSALADLGIEYVVLPQPADADFVAALDGTLGLSRASTTVERLVGWQLDANVGQVRLLDPSDLQPEVSAEVLPAPRGQVDTDIPVGGEADRLLLLASTTGGFVATLDGVELSAADHDGLGQAFTVGSEEGRLEVSHDRDRARWLLLQLVLVLSCVVLAAPALDRREGITEVHP